MQIHPPKPQGKDLLCGRMRVCAAVPALPILLLHACHAACGPAGGRAVPFRQRHLHAETWEHAHRQGRLRCSLCVCHSTCCSTRTDGGRGTSLPLGSLIRRLLGAMTALRLAAVSFGSLSAADSACTKFIKHLLIAPWTRGAASAPLILPAKRPFCQTIRGPPFITDESRGHCPKPVYSVAFPTRRGNALQATCWQQCPR